jgi:5-methylcytosine-specific restriction enzyme subunit McrC
MRLTLFEEQQYQEDEVLGKIADALGDAPATKKVDEAWSALKSLRIRRANILDPAGLSPRRQADPDDDPPGDTIPLFRRTSTGGWFVAGLVGSCTLAESSLSVEVLPKTGRAGNADTDLPAARRQLLRMWQVAEGAPLNEHQAPAAAEADSGLHEWLIQRFLADIDALLLRGLRPQYLEREDNLSVLRGRLLPLQNLRVNAVAPHRFYCRFEELSLDRPEHRLIRTALHKIARRTQNPANRRRAASLGESLHEVTISTDVARDFSAWRDDRLMLHYRRIRSSCEWILAERTAAPIRGHNEMFGCFARMHQLFERYVAKWLSAKYAKLYRIDVQKEKVFCRGPQGSEIMRPDILVKQGGTTLGIIDSKWKIGKDEGIARPDLYQMISYARFHFPTSDDGSGRFLGVIYPAIADADRPARKMTFSEPMEAVPLYLQWFRLPRFVGARWHEGLALEGLNSE